MHAPPSDETTVPSGTDSGRPAPAAGDAMPDTPPRAEAALRHLLDQQERDRQLVAYEIHDGLAQYVAGALMHLQASLGDTIGPPTRQRIEEAIRLLRVAAAESRRLIGSLRPPALEEQGLVEAISSLVAEARTDGPAVEFSHSISGDAIPSPVASAIYRITQEALANARRHARARHVRVALEPVPGGIRLCIRDDGSGFDPATVPRDRFGLEGIRHRARLLGAEPRIESGPGRGTSVEIDFPVT